MDRRTGSSWSRRAGMPRVGGAAPANARAILEAQLQTEAYLIRVGQPVTDFARQAAEAAVFQPQPEARIEVVAQADAVIHAVAIAPRIEHRRIEPAVDDRS